MWYLPPKVFKSIVAHPISTDNTVDREHHRSIFGLKIGTGGTTVLFSASRSGQVATALTYHCRSSLQP